MTFAGSIRRFHREESGQDLVEYALILVAVATGALTGSANLAGNFSTWIGNLQTRITTMIG